MADRPRRRRAVVVGLVVCGVATAAAAGGVAGGAESPRALGEPRRPLGCQAAGPSFRLAGPPTAKVVALTFDDGPGPVTPAILDVLARERVPATFFPVGRLIPGQEHLLRRALAGGGALGNHSFTHANLGAGGLEELRAGQAAIQAATGYTPCVFQAPANKYGLRLIAQARSLGMLTVQWSADSRDWTGASASAIHANVLARVRPGAIVLMHDEGPNRAQTQLALPRIIQSLRLRGYRFVTVPAILRLRSRYG